MASTKKSNKRVWSGIEPGDVGFDGGVGLVGLIIKLGTRSNYGHCWVYHQRLDVAADGTEIWDTVEAGGIGGVQHRIRTRQPNKVVRLWRNYDERAAILHKSEQLVGCKYGWGEIVRIAFRMLGLRLRRRKDNAQRVICSNHSTQALLAGRPELVHYLRFPYYETWPGELAVALDEFLWETEVN